MASFDRLYVNGMGEKLFVIPSYQRGYRWTPHNVTQLLDDLASFTDKEYCLQPLVLQEIDELKKQEIRSNYDSPKWDEYKGYPFLRVVDGQQRLTTISLIAAAIYDNAHAMSWDIYYETEKKFLSELLHNHGKTINDDFRKEAQNAIKTFKDNNEDIFLDRIEKLFNPDRGRKVCFLEYCIDEKDDEHDTFRRLNDGKTPLTSSELIRALYMVNSSKILKKDRLEISKEWELMEQALQNEQFWLMFNSIGLKDTPTRVDLLFALVLGVKLDKTKANPLLIFETLDSPIKDSNGKTTDKHYDLVKVWHEVLRCFWWMQSCYDDIETFNYLCWIAQFTDNRATTIYGQWYAYPVINEFKKHLIVKIQENMQFGNFDEIHYDPSNTKYLRKLFVLFNIYYCNQRLERFRFDLYNNESWDIEHIDSQTLNNLQDETSQRQWLESAIAEVALSDDEKKALLNLETFDQKYNRIIELWSKCDPSVDIKSEMLSGEEKDKLGNLALLNSGINRGYRNSIFPTKRKTLIKDIVGEEEDKSENNEIIENRIFIPPLTQMAFVKTFTREASKITYWLRQDAEGCRNAYKKAYDFFSSPGVADNPNTGHACGPQQEDFAAVEPSKKTRISACKKDNYDFVTFLNNYKIIIPKIQRLYVQGRRDKHGKKCLNGFATELVEKVISGSEHSLDMIYGIAKDNNFFLPLDGQQRLTTMLLLSWLLGEVWPENPNIANGERWSFRYETRRATEVFIEKLINTEPPKLKKSNNYDERRRDNGIDKPERQYDYLPLIREYIRGQAWFLPTWEKDPGIDGMLEMLDSLYDKLIDPERYKIANIKPQQEWNIKNISFYVNFLDVSDENYDQIFLKMNSRGKELTQWENIKAILDYYAPDDSGTWEDDLSFNWPEKLWKSPQIKSAGIGTLDDCMLGITELALKYAGYAGDITDTFKLDLWLGAQQTNKDIFYRCCRDLFSALEKNDTWYEDFHPSWETSPCLPNFYLAKSDSGRDDLYKYLAAFYAKIKFFEKCRDDISHYADWMRVVWNIVENGEICSSADEFIKALKFFDELSKHAANILDFLAKVKVQDGKEKSPFAGDQVREECLKAWLIENSQDQKAVKNLICEIEEQDLFKGRIISLMLKCNDDNGLNYSKYISNNNISIRPDDLVDWSKLEKRYKRLMGFFDGDSDKTSDKASQKIGTELLKYGAGNNDYCIDLGGDRWQFVNSYKSLFSFLHNREEAFYEEPIIIFSKFLDNDNGSRSFGLGDWRYYFYHYNSFPSSNGNGIFRHPEFFTCRLLTSSSEVAKNCNPYIMVATEGIGNIDIWSSSRNSYRGRCKINQSKWLDIIEKDGEICVVVEEERQGDNIKQRFLWDRNNNFIDFIRALLS